MLKKTTIALLLLASIASCKTKNAFNYSQEIVKKEQSLLPEITSTEEKVKRYIETEQFDSMAIAGKRMEQLVDAKMKEVKNTPAPDAKGAEDFKEASLKYFGFIKDMYTAYVDYGNAGSAENREAEMQKLIILVNKKTNAIKAMQDAQQKFAIANGFKIESTQYSSGK